ncbi:MAG: hypothetical protein CL920_26140 [Deltaproteobacteria bacterium]|nr:hypothetical protein [Deltaproteobacteria bacterium]|tara:strand:+ start:4128 stop:4439 length:312 start_codon:yes stop_codon:yes gene_type:complete
MSDNILSDRITLEAGCTNALLWRYTPPDDASFDDIGAKLIKAGFSDITEQLWLRLFLHPDEHRIVYIPKTNRIQLRIHYLTPPEQRPQMASHIADCITKALAS